MPDCQPPQQLLPPAYYERTGDIPPPLDLWMEGELDYLDLPPENQREARSTVTRDGHAFERLTGAESSVRFLPGERFTGVDHDWLIQRLVLSPRFGRARSSVYGEESIPRFTCFLDDEEIEVLDEVDGFPLGPKSDYWGNEIASVGSDSMSDMTIVAATLYEASPWLVSEWQEVQTDFLPIPTNEMGEESDYRMAYETWTWTAEMTAEWVNVGAEQDLAIKSAFLADDDDADEMLEHIARAAHGGRGTVAFNGTVISQPGVHR